MNTHIQTSADSDIPEGAYISVCTGLSSDALPKVENSSQSENSNTGVSTHFVPLPKEILDKRRAKRTPRWFALRAAYGHEKTSYQYLVNHDVEAFYPTITTTHVVNGKKVSKEISRIPNIFFARATEDELKVFVFDNENLPHLRFYYRHIRKGNRIVNEPVIVPDYQMEGLKIICASGAHDVLVVPDTVQKFQQGQSVRVTDGAFAGLEGKVARYHGQQRVAVIIDGLLTMASAYIPSAFLEKIK